MFSVISATTIVVLAALAGWLIGLTAHAFHVVQWKDPGARAVWAAGSGLGIGTALLASIGVSLLTRGPVFLLAIPVALTAGTIGAWRASELLQPRETDGEHPAPARSRSRR